MSFIIIITILEGWVVRVYVRSTSEKNKIFIFHSGMPLKKCRKEKLRSSNIRKGSTYQKNRLRAKSIKVVSLEEEAIKAGVKNCRTMIFVTSFVELLDFSKQYACVILIKTKTKL